MDLNRIITLLGSSGVAGGLAGGVAGGALTSALMSRKGRKHAKTLLAAGGLAAVGGIAWKAYKAYQQQNQGANAAATPEISVEQQQWQGLEQQDFAITNTSSEGSRGLLVIRAMITAAMADGHMDAGERGRIVGSMDSLALGADEKALVVDELLHPKSVDDIVRAVVDQESAIEVYAASVLAIDETLPAGDAYLEDLAMRLALPPLLTEALRGRVQAARRSQEQAA